MTRRIASICAAFFLSATFAQGQQTIQLPSLSIEGSRIESNVQFDAQRGVYTYSYALVAAATNKAPINAFGVDTTGRIERTQLDPDLHNNIQRIETTDVGQVQPSTTIPVGVIVPSSASDVLAGPGFDGWTMFVFGGSMLTPGQTLSGFKLESKLPPAWRDGEIHESEQSWNAITDATSDPDVDYTPDCGCVYWIHQKVLAPYDLDESALFDGGGQSPREVNPFLRYVAPTESRVHLAAGTAKYDVTLLYGPTTDPATFSATLDGTDITSQFRPMAGVVDTVTIPLKAGTTKLKLSIQGKTSSGRVARDTDALTFIVK